MKGSQARGLLLLGLIFFLRRPSASGPESRCGKFDHLDKIAGLPITVLGHPHVIKTPLGKAIQFNGVDDASHPSIARRERCFTFEGDFSQRGLDHMRVSENCNGKARDFIQMVKLPHLDSGPLAEGRRRKINSQQQHPTRLRTLHRHR